MEECCINMPEESNKSHLIGKFVLLPWSRTEFTASLAYACTFKFKPLTSEQVYCKMWLKRRN